MLNEVLGERRLLQADARGSLSSHDLDIFGIFMANKVGGTTSAFDLARWMNTPEGRVIMQYHSMAMTQTRVFKDEILKPAARGNIMPLLKWGSAVFMTTSAMGALTAGLYNVFGGEAPEDEPEGATGWAWHFLQVTNMTFATGYFGDLAAGMDTPEGIVPLVGTMAGPTVSTLLNTVKDLALYPSDIEKKGESDRFQRIIRREFPGLNFLSKTGNLPILEKK